MITLTAYRGRKVGVFGLGKAGEATVASLLAGGAEVFAWDDNEKSRDALKKKHAGAQILPLAQWPWKELACMVLSPGVPYTHPAPHPAVRLAQEAGCEIVGDIELLYRACPKARYVGITGTNGKSTTTTLIGHMLQQADVRAEVGGNLGTPALSFAPLGEDGVYVIETSSYQLDLLSSVRFNVAVLLNLTPDHLDRHGDMEGYLAAKLHIFERQQAGDAAIIAVDDDYTRRIAGSWQGAAKLVTVSASEALQNGVYVESGILKEYFHGVPPYSLDVSDIVTLTGKHNWQNAAAAWATVRMLGVEPEVIERSIRSFPGLRHRLQQAAVVNGVPFINDSKATNADAVSHALPPYRNIYWIAGGKPKAGGIESLEPLFPHVAHAFLIGEAAEAFGRTLEGKVPYTQSGTLENAVSQAAEKAFAEQRPGAVVLLSPACASFDQFKSFEERGDVFCSLVAAMEKRHAA